MKPRQLLIALMLFICFSVFGLQSKNNNALSQSKQPTVEQLLQENDSIKRQLSDLKGRFDLYHNDVLSKESQINDTLVIWFGFFTIIMAIVGVAFPLILNRRAEAQAEEAKNQATEAKNQATEATNQATEAKQLVGTAQGEVSKAKKEVSKAQNQAAQAKTLVQNAQTQAKEAKKHAETARDQVGLIESKVNEAIKQATKAANVLKDIEALKEQINRIKSDVDVSKDEAVQVVQSAKAREYFSQAQAENEPEKAIDLYSIAIENDPNYSEAYNNRGLLRMISEDTEGAMSDFNDAIEKDENNPVAYFNRGCLKDKLGEKDNAKEDYDRAIELNPDYAEALNKRSNILLSNGMLDDAMNDANQAIIIGPANFEYFETRGDIYMAKEKYEEAIKDYTDALNNNLSAKHIYQKRAACYNKLARLEQDEEKTAVYLKNAQADIRRSVN